MTFASTVAAQVGDLLGVSTQVASPLVIFALETLGLDGRDGQYQSTTSSASSAGGSTRWSTEEEKVGAVVEVAVSAHFERSASASASASASVHAAASASTSTSPPKKKKRPRAASPANTNMHQKTMGAFFALPPGKSIKTQRTIASSVKSKANQAQVHGHQPGEVKQETDGSDDEIIEVLDDETNSEEDTKVGIKRENDEEEDQVQDAPMKIEGGNDDNDALATAARAIKAEDATDADVAQVDFSSVEFDAKALGDYYIGRKISPPFLHLTKALTLVASTTKRLEKERFITNYLLSLLYYDRMRGIEWDDAELQTGELIFADCSVLHAVLLSGNVASTGLVLNIGHSAISQAICNALSCSSTKLSQKARDRGELGDGAADIFSGRDVGSAGGAVKQTRLQWGPPPKPLLLSDITDTIGSLHALAKDGGGKGIEGKRKEALYKIFSRCKEHEEVRFAVKIFCEHVRTGATLITLLRCLSAAHVLQLNGYVNANWQDDSKGKEKHSIDKSDIEQAQEQFRINYSRHHHLKACILSLVKYGLDGMTERCDVQVFCPIQPMLAAPSRGVKDVINHYNEHYASACEDASTKQDTNVYHVLNTDPFLTAEYKYDGQRAQLHAATGDDGKVKVQIYSRHLDDMTAKFASSVVPWIEDNFPSGISSFVIDAEICAVKRDEEETVLLPFQVLSTMKRSEDESTSSSGTGGDVAVCIFAFDALLIDDKELLSRPLSERRAVLREKLGYMITPGHFELTKSIDVPFSGNTGMETTKTKLDEFLAESVGPSGRCEGLMLKSLYSLYHSHESREKSGGFGGWRKLKRDYIDDLADSIDVIPIGAWRGSGRKANWFSPFLCAIYEPSTGEYQSLCRVMSGFSDEFYQSKFAFYAKKTLDERPENVVTGEAPPYWFEPTEVWEIRGADLTISPVHKAAVGRLDGLDGNVDLDDEEGRGISLRFPRFVRVRDDKKLDEATSSTQILSLFLSQSQRQKD
mmetsp:Transcript_12056/g.34478  ORF Transcript_12056/g.34478 Transcript_12056/m.34478 type:complete len:982 (+) Transcript_12056:74-3019(+)